MAKPEELYNKWKQHCPAEVDADDLKKVIKHYLSPWLSEGKTGSHLLIIKHIALAVHSAFGGKDTLAISFKSGRRVKGVWVDHTLKAIDSIDLYESIKNQKEKPL